MIFKVPPNSQLADIKNAYWKKRSCGVVALKMVLAYERKSSDVIIPSLQALLEKGISIRAFTTKNGWSHCGLTKLARVYGFRGKNFDWFKKSDVYAFKKMLFYLAKGPLIISIHKNFNSHDVGHLIVLTGFENSKIFYNDPYSKIRSNVPKIISVRKFLKGWKRRIIVVYPKDYSI